MGLSNTTNQATWISLSNGIFKVKAHDGSVSEYISFSGTLSGIGFANKKGYEGREIRQMILTFRDGNDTYKIGIDTTNGYARSIKMKLPNVDITQPFELCPTYKAETKDASCFINQFGSPVKQKWTRDNPGSLPPCDQVTVGAKTVYDFSKQEAWLEQYLMQHIAPVAAKNAAHSSSHDRTSQGDAHAGENQDYNQEDGSGIPNDDPNTPF